MGGRTFSNLEPVGCKFVKLPLNFIIPQTGKKNTAGTGHPISTECFPQDRFLWFQQSSLSSFSLTLALTGELSCLSRTHSSGSPSSEGGSFFSWTHQTPQSSSRILRLHWASSHHGCGVQVLIHPQLRDSATCAKPMEP